MTALTENRKARQIDPGKYRVDPFAILDEEEIFFIGLLARDVNGEVQMASDTAGLVVDGMTQEYIDNENDGETTNPQLTIRLLNNSATYPIARTQIGGAAYVEDDNVVGGYSTNLIAAGLIYDVTSDGVFVDCRPESLAIARRLAANVVTAKTDDYTITGALAFQGNQIFTGAKDGGMAFTLPSAVPGMRVGIVRPNATAAYDVDIQAGTGDTVLGSEAAKKVTNAVDAVSQVLWLAAVSATAWVADSPTPGDLASWVIDNT